MIYFRLGLRSSDGHRVHGNGPRVVSGEGIVYADRGYHVIENSHERNV